ncbi:uncharacterized protein FIESC28_02827 [Fusarium coffeatum]|uniref:Uncharacterized protein n=1 Tax=Fusarium coffeatum TaxID=231269 RepID=A0A366S4S5_9HYPO|nr:uncharacterized protein FIESC28_02827 [Fusarium coffeatum]RBR24337.1 hypothetical protein FIESC28_02827 [Fusarium coffeatum]
MFSSGLGDSRGAVTNTRQTVSSASRSAPGPQSVNYPVVLQVGADEPSTDQVFSLDYGSIGYRSDDVLQPPSSNAILDGFYRCLIIEAYISSIYTLYFFWSEDSSKTSSVESSTIDDTLDQIPVFVNSTKGPPNTPPRHRADLAVTQDNAEKMLALRVSLGNPERIMTRDEANARRDLALRLQAEFDDITPGNEIHEDDLPFIIKSPRPRIQFYKHTCNERAYAYKTVYAYICSTTRWMS